MPNWTTNKLTVHIPTTDVEAFLKAVGGSQYPGKPEEVLCAHKIVPYPKDFYDKDLRMHELGGVNIKECPKCGKLYGNNDATFTCRSCKTDLKAAKDGFNSGGYEWCVTNWGTKWGFCEPRLVSRTSQMHGKREITVLSFEYDTAWSPASPLIAVLAERWPQATFTVDYKLEEGGGGREHYERGKVKTTTYKER